MQPPRILNPHSIPVAGDDHHLDPVDPRLLTSDGLRALFGGGRPFEAPIRGDVTWAERAPSAAAVLVCLVHLAQGVQVRLPRRAWA